MLSKTQLEQIAMRRLDAIELIKMDIRTLINEVSRKNILAVDARLCIHCMTIFDESIRDDCPICYRKDTKKMVAIDIRDIDDMKNLVPIG